MGNWPAMLSDHVQSIAAAGENRVAFQSFPSFTILLDVFQYGSASCHGCHGYLHIRIWKVVYCRRCTSALRSSHNEWGLIDLLLKRRNLRWPHFASWFAQEQVTRLFKDGVSLFKRWRWRLLRNDDTFSYVLRLLLLLLLQLVAEAKSMRWCLVRLGNTHVKDRTFFASYATH